MTHQLLSDTVYIFSNHRIIEEARLALNFFSHLLTKHYLLFERVEVDASPDIAGADPGYVVFGGDFNQLAELLPWRPWLSQSDEGRLIHLHQHLEISFRMLQDSFVGACLLCI